MYSHGELDPTFSKSTSLERMAPLLQVDMQNSTHKDYAARVRNLPLLSLSRQSVRRLGCPPSLQADGRHGARGGGAQEAH